MLNNFLNMCDDNGIINLKPIFEENLSYMIKFIKCIDPLYPTDRFESQLQKYSDELQDLGEKLRVTNVVYADAHLNFEANHVDYEEITKLSFEEYVRLGRPFLMRKRTITILESPEI